MKATAFERGFSVTKAHETQLQLSKRIIFEDRLPERIRYVAGVDVAYVNDESIGAVAVLEFDSLKLAETQTVSCKTRFPYIPTLLSFREAPPSILAIRKLSSRPDVFIADGHGYAHPYRCGFASHLGLVLGRPAIGVAKQKLVGEVEFVVSCDTAALVHRGEIIGAELRTRPETNPVYVSVGHMITLGTAVDIVKRCVGDYRIPEPILAAHRAANEKTRKEKAISSDTLRGNGKGKQVAHAQTQSPSR